MLASSSHSPNVYSYVFTFQTLFYTSTYNIYIYIHRNHIILCACAYMCGFMLDSSVCYFLLVLDLGDLFIVHIELPYSTFCITFHSVTSHLPMDNMCCL